MRLLYSRYPFFPLLPSVPRDRWRFIIIFDRLREPTTLLPTIIAGLQTYFDRALGANLLYRFERPQYAEIRRQYVTGPTVVVGQEKEMSSIYGAEHLLRMLGTYILHCCAWK